MTHVQSLCLELFSCDFEENFCDMQQDTLDSKDGDNRESGSYDWTRDKDGTPSWFTGPSSGHKSKHYIYVEGSGQPARAEARYRECVIHKNNKSSCH